MEPGFGSWYALMARSVSLRMNASSSTQSSGGSPPFDSPRDIDPRLQWKRTPLSLAASITQSTVLPLLKTYVWSKTVVQPDSASSAHPTSTLSREAAGVVAAQMRYCAFSQGNRLLFWQAGRLRHSVWLRWWWQFTKPGKTICPNMSRTVSAAFGKSAAGPTCLMTPSSANRLASLSSRRWPSMVTSTSAFLASRVDTVTLPFSQDPDTPSEPRTQRSGVTGPLSRLLRSKTRCMRGSDCRNHPDTRSINHHSTHHQVEDQCHAA